MAPFTLASESKSEPKRAPLVSVLRDVAFEGGSFAGPQQRLDLYVPSGASDFPVLVWLHGGGLVEGDKQTDEPLARRFASSGIGVVVPNYRLSPQVAHPVHAQDAAAALNWTARHISDWGGNARRLVVAGHSAGAYLAALLATFPRLLPDVGLRGLVAVSGFYWVERVAPGRSLQIWGSSKDEWLAASPARHLQRALPPSLFVYADGDDDDRQRQNIDMAEAARAAGNSVELARIAGRDHVSLARRIAEADDELGFRIESFVRTVTA